MRSDQWALRLLVLTAALGLSTCVCAEPSQGKTLYRHCKTCHGVDGQGGKGGKYPRIAGLPKDYISKQLNAFKTRKRINKPMIPLFKDWRFNADAMAAVAEYVAGLPEPAVEFLFPEPSPEVLADFDSRDEYEELGAELFQSTCAQCHGEDGRGKADKESPPLVNQYPSYIRKQIEDFIAGRRIHEHSKKMFGELYPEEVDSLLLYLTRLGHT